MNAIHNLSQLLEQSQCQFKIFDLGRRIQAIEPKIPNKLKWGKNLTLTHCSVMPT